MKHRHAIATTPASANLGRLGAKLRSLSGYLVPMPSTGRLLLDVVYLIVVGAIHFSVFPSLTRSLFVVDLLTPWVVVSLITQDLPRGAVVGGLGALILETHSVAPAGIYVTSFWIIAVVINLTKSTLSWRHVFPWFVTLFVAEAWVMAFEAFVQGVQGFGAGLGGVLRLDASHLAHESLRLVVSTGFGLLISHRFMFVDLPNMSGGSPHPAAEA